jgi:hypothetical protein
VKENAAINLQNRPDDGAKTRRICKKNVKISARRLRSQPSVLRFFAFFQIWSEVFHKGGDTQKLTPGIPKATNDAKTRYAPNVRKGFS